MKKIIFVILLSILFVAASNAQTNPTATPTPKTQSAKEGKPKKQIFRANKDQITQAQTMLKGKAMYNGEATGKLDPDTRTALKKYQSGNGLKATGTLNRATLEKMSIGLTDKQKEIPVSPNSYATKDDKTDKPKRMIFRATKEQVMQAQKMLKQKGMYSGEETGKLDDATRDGLKKFQEANGLKSTGTLNQVTLEKMGISLTDKQKENAKTDSQ
ncbi:MAG: peptidoglycan-binding domain-containing protein [Pyrinomonadaceae bacterium]